jgi:hypothetical protein
MSDLTALAMGAAIVALINLLPIIWANAPCMRKGQSNRTYDHDLFSC